MPVFRRSRDFFSDMLRQTDLVLLALCAAACACAAQRLCGSFLCKEVRLGRLHRPGRGGFFGPPFRRAVE